MGGSPSFSCRLHDPGGTRKSEPGHGFDLKAIQEAAPPQYHDAGETWKEKGRRKRHCGHLGIVHKPAGARSVGGEGDVIYAVKIERLRRRRIREAQGEAAFLGGAPSRRSQRGCSRSRRPRWCPLGPSPKRCAGETERGTVRYTDRLIAVAAVIGRIRRGRKGYALAIHTIAGGVFSHFPTRPGEPLIARGHVSLIAGAIGPP